jgi:phosphatidylserine decarboxylase
MLPASLARLQYALPRHWLTAVTHRLTRIRYRPAKDRMINAFVRLYDIDLDEVARAAPEEFDSLNDFFTRELAPGARPVDGDPASVVSPADGTVSQAGIIAERDLLQAKGFEYTVDELLAVDLETAARFTGGRFATIYLAPHNYHRVHMPFAGRLETAHFVPGELFSVNDATAATIPRLFSRNERLCLHFTGASGPFAVVLVGALNVGSISTPWTGEIRARKHGMVESLDIGAERPVLDKGDLLGWFNLGSTVIVLFPDGAVEWDDFLATGCAVRMGEAIGRRTND